MLSNEKFKTSGGVRSCTANFDVLPTSLPNVKMIDTPGLNDPKIPIYQWINLYN